MSVVSRARVEEREASVPASVPGDFVISLGTNSIPDASEAGMAELLLTWIEWVEVEALGCPDCWRDFAGSEGLR